MTTNEILSWVIRPDKRLSGKFHALPRESRRNVLCALGNAPTADDVKKAIKTARRAGNAKEIPMNTKQTPAEWTITGDEIDALTLDSANYVDGTPLTDEEMDALERDPDFYSEMIRRFAERGM